MSIYATLWTKNVQVDDREHEVIAQAVLPHIGQPSEGCSKDPYATFLPPPVTPYDPDDGAMPYRAVVIIDRRRSQKEGQHYVHALLTLSGEEYNKLSEEELQEKIREALDPERN